MSTQVHPYFKSKPVQYVYVMADATVATTAKEPSQTSWIPVFTCTGCMVLDQVTPTPTQYNKGFITSARATASVKGRWLEGGRRIKWKVWNTHSCMHVNYKPCKHTLLRFAVYCQMMTWRRVTPPHQYIHPSLGPLDFMCAP